MLLFWILTAFHDASACISSSTFWRQNFEDIYPQKLPSTLKGVHAYTFRGKKVVAKFHGRDRSRSRAMQEIAMLRRFRGASHVVQYRFCISDGNYIAIFTERLRTDLGSSLRHFHRLGLHERFQLLLGPTRVLATMHDQNLVHGDLKPYNLMVDMDGETLKLIDFDCTTHAGSRILGHTVFYAAPEVVAVHRDRISRKTHDVWSWTLTLVEMFVPQLRQKVKAMGGEYPPKALNHAHVAMIRKEIRKTGRAYGVSFAFFVKWLERDPQRRPTMKEIKETLARIVRHGNKGPTFRPVKKKTFC